MEDWKSFVEVVGWKLEEKQGVDWKPFAEVVDCQLLGKWVVGECCWAVVGELMEVEI